MADNNKLDLETFVRAYIDLRTGDSYRFPEVYDEFWGLLIRYNLDKKSTLFLRNNYGMREIENENWYDNLMTNWKNSPEANKESVQRVIKMIENAKDKPDEAHDIIEIIKFAQKPFDYTNMKNGGKENSLYILKFIDILGKFKDQDLAYKVAKSLPYNEFQDVNVRKALLVMLANNKNATVEDVYRVYELAQTSTDTMIAINDVLGKTDEEITKALSKEIPDIERLQQVVKFPKYVVNGATDKYKTYTDFTSGPDQEGKRDKFYKNLAKLKEQVEEKYNIDKILEIGGNNYVAKYDESVMQKVSDLEQQVSASKKTVTAAQSENQRLLHELEMRDEKITELQKKLQEERIAKDKSENTRKMLTGQLKMLQDLMAKVRGGLGAKGIDELRQAMDKVNSMEI